jgi:hypothetical protein
MREETMALTRISSQALKADLTIRGFSGWQIRSILDQAQDTGEYRSITFRIVADDNEQQFYVENFPPLARLREDDPLARYDGQAGDLVPGYADSPDGLADAADQARADRGNR